jgi:hypothetical protein
MGRPDRASNSERRDSGVFPKQMGAAAKNIPLSQPKCILDIYWCSINFPQWGDSVFTLLLAVNVIWVIFGFWLFGFCGFRFWFLPKIVLCENIMPGLERILIGQ